MTTEAAPMEIVSLHVDDVVDDKIGKDDNAYTGITKEILENLKNSLLVDGQIHPISVRKHPDKPDKFLVVTGRKRLKALRLAGISSVFAQVLSYEDEIRYRSRILAENLHRSPLNKAKHLAAMQEWYRHFLHLDAVRRGETPVVTAEAPKAPEPPAPEAAKDEAPKAKPKRTKAEVKADAEFVEQVKAATGLSDTQAKSRLKIVHSLDPEQLRALEACDVGVTDLGRIAAVRDDEERARVVNLVVAGAEIDEVLDPGDKPPKPEAPKAQVADAQSDRDYAAKYCSTLYQKLAERENTEAFVASVGLYRAIVDQKAEFTRKIAKPLKEAKVKANHCKGGGFTRMVASLCSTTHPRDWLLCSACKGSGRAENPTGIGESRCRNCQGDGFKLQFDRA